MKKQVKKLKKVEKQLRGSVKKHAKQADTIKDTIKLAGKYMDKD